MKRRVVGHFGTLSVPLYLSHLSLSLPPPQPTSIDLIHREDRPKLLTIQNATDVLLEHWHFRQSAYHTFHADDVARLEIRFCTIENRVNSEDSHGIINLGAFNTDGFDVSGRDIYIHDSSVWNQDDCFTIVPSSSTSINSNCTENVLVENVNASGLGLTIGSIEPTRSHS